MKGASLPMKILIVTVVLLVTMGIVMFIIQMNLKRTGGVYDKLTLETMRSACKASAGLGQANVDYIDRDFGRGRGDGFPDNCDLCLGGDDKKDKNIPPDQIPDACEPPNFKPDKKVKMADICNNAKLCTSGDCWEKEAKRCVLTCYAKGCPR